MIKSFKQLHAAIIVSFLIVSPALAGEVPLYQPAPDWIETFDIESVLAAKESSNDLIVAVDRQVKMEDGQTWQYADVILRGGSSETLAQIGRLQGMWNPELGDFIVHNVQIIRNGESIDPLADGKTFDILRREAGLEKLQINGVLTAFLQLEGLQIGDLVRLRASTTIRDPAMGGHMQLVEPLLAEPIRLQFGRFKLIWPKADNVRWQVAGKDAESKISTKGAYKNLIIEQPLPKQQESVPGAPLRYVINPMIEATSFEDWAAVSRTAARLYNIEGLIAEGSALAKEADIIAGQTSDPKERTAAALQLVQDKVRYLFNGLGGGNYTPQSPDKTWTLRYGDCKAKTLLLLALLDRLGIEAQPAMVHTTLADALSERLPTLAAFDHIIARATIDGRVYWLDGTRSGDRLADLADTPAFRYALPLETGGADLETIELMPMQRPLAQITLSIDASAGIGFPAPYALTIVSRGPVVEQMSAVKNSVSSTEYEELLDGFITQYAGDKASITDREALFDEASGTVSVTGRGLMTSSWANEHNRRTYSIDNYLDNTEVLSNRTKAEWQAIPYAMHYPGYYVRKLQIVLPNEGEGFELVGQADVAGTIAGYEQLRKSEIVEGKLSVNEFWRTAMWELPADMVTAERAKLMKIQSEKLRVKAPELYPPAWLETKTAVENNKLEPIIAAYKADIALHPDDSRPYENFARFYQGTYQYAKAAEQLSFALKQEENPETYVWLASLYHITGDKRAIEAAHKALELDPASLAAISAIAEIYAKRNQTDKALQFLATVENNGVDEDAIASVKAEVMMLEGKYGEALASVDKLLAKKPNDPEYLNLRCWNKGRANVQLDTALKDCTKAIQLAESSSAILDSRALVFFRLGQFDDAMSDLNTALDFNPNLAPSLYLRGMTYSRLGEQSKSASDISAAKYMMPKIVDDYAFLGLVP